MTLPSPLPSSWSFFWARNLKPVNVSKHCRPLTSATFRAISVVTAQVNDKEAVEKVADTFKMVYTPFHGTGHKLIPEALKRGWR